MIRRAWFALTIWRWWLPVAWRRYTYCRGPYDPYGDIPWSVAWCVAGLAVGHG